MLPTPPLPSPNDAVWETMWAPSSDGLCQEVLAHIQPGDVILDIGAGDMRLTMQMAHCARHVYALEIQASLIEYSLETLHLPSNLTILHADARIYPFPLEITTAVLMMRHCLHFHLYANKLKITGCRKLITNARWRAGIEVIELQAPRQIFEQSSLGWYACWCGNTGFKPGPVEELDEKTINTVHEVVNCPNCSSL